MAGVQHTLDLFFQVSSFTRYLLDDVLPAEVYGKQSIQIDTLESLVQECDALVVSLRSFTQLTKSLQGSEGIYSSSQTNYGNLSGSFQNDKQDYLKFTELCVVIRKKVAALSDLIKVKPYFCKICNLATSNEHVFNQHCASKKHVEQTNQTPEPLTIYKCKICLLLLITPQSEINSITSIPGHSLLDEHIQKLKGSTDKFQGKDVVNTSHSKSGTDKIGHDDDIPEVSDKTIKSDILEVYSVPQNVNRLFQIMRKRLQTDTNLSEVVPHYCNVCDVVAFSVGKFIQHSSHKEHISAVNSAVKPIIVHKCEKCGFLVTGYQMVIDSIINSIGHRDLDEYIRTLKASKETGKNVDEKFPLSDLKTFVPNTYPIKEISKRVLIPEDLKNAINTLSEKLRFPSDLKKFAPSYCYICNKVFFSSNDFKQHLTSKKHNMLTSSPAIPLHVHNCPICLISLFGSEPDVGNAIDSLEHINLHKKLNYLFRGASVPSDTNKNTSDQDVTKPNTILEFNAALKETIHSVSELRKSHMPKEIVEVSDPNVTSYSESSQNVNQDSKGNLAPAMRLDKGIPDKFLTINSKLQCENFSKSGFCRPCKKGINITQGWTSHLLCSKHRKAMEKLQFENIPLPCKYCPLQVLGDEVFDNVCMNMHMKLNHPNKKLIDTQNGTLPVTVKNEMVETVSDVCSGSSSDQSKSSEKIRCNESSNITRNSLELSIEKKDIQLTTQKNSNTQCTLANISNDLDNNQFCHEHFNQESNTSTSKSKSSSVVVFTKFLEKRKTAFLNEGLKQFGGMCLLCAQTFEDYYDWLLHLKDPCHNNVNCSDVVERECSNCNLSFYGRKVVIDTEFWPLREHASLDALIIQ